MTKLWNDILREPDAPAPERSDRVRSMLVTILLALPLLKVKLNRLQVGEAAMTVDMRSGASLFGRPEMHRLGAAFDDLGGSLKAMLAEPVVSDEECAVDSIGEVGPGRSFLGEKLTARRCHTESYRPCGRIRLSGVTRGPASYTEVPPRRKRLVLILRHFFGRTRGATDYREAPSNCRACCCAGVGRVITSKAGMDFRRGCTRFLTIVARSFSQS